MTITVDRIKVVGCGGIGGHLAPNLCHFLYAERRAAHVTLVDGDTYEPGNAARMRFRNLENKAVAMARELASAFGAVLTLEPVPAYLTPANIATLVESGDVVFLAVDNHQTRHLIDAHCATLPDVTLISGGNDGVEDGATGTFGNVQVVRRAAGRPLTNTLACFHPEIETPADRIPGELSCTELAAAGVAQLLFTNLAVASAMLNAFYGLLRDAVPYEEVYLDIAKNRMQPVERALA
jgi:molybdopterin/thiamine biosynthesis adenylyltransferase